MGMVSQLPFATKAGESDLGVNDEVSNDDFPSGREVVLSIKPFYSDKILEGMKTVELRRRAPALAARGTRIYIYSTSPVKAMVGAAVIEQVVKLPIDSIWSRYKRKAIIQREPFEHYFRGLEFGCALLIGDARTFRRALPLSELRQDFGFEPPQSFLYPKCDLRKVLEDESTNAVA